MNGEGAALVVLRRVRVQADAGFEVDVSPLELQNLARDPPAGDVGELHGWTDGRWQMSKNALDLLADDHHRAGFLAAVARLSDWPTVSIVLTHQTAPRWYDMPIRVSSFCVCECVR